MHFSKCNGSGQNSRSCPKESTIVEGEDGANDGQNVPIEGQNAPSEGQHAPIEGQYAPNEGQDAPIEGQVVPIEGTQKGKKREYKKNEGAKLGITTITLEVATKIDLSHFAPWSQSQLVHILKSS